MWRLGIPQELRTINEAFKYTKYSTVADECCNCLY